MQDVGPLYVVPGSDNHSGGSYCCIIDVLSYCPVDLDDTVFDSLDDALVTYEECKNNSYLWNWTVKHVNTRFTAWMIGMDAKSSDLCELVWSGNDVSDVSIMLKNKRYQFSGDYMVPNILLTVDHKTKTFETKYLSGNGHCVDCNR